MKGHKGGSELPRRVDVEGRVKVNAEGVRITLLEGMELYLIYLWIECPFRLFAAFMA